MIPEHDFCTPYFMDTNVTLIEECVNADQAKCSGQCKWRKGKVVGTNNELIKGADLFGANFCHPPTTDKWEENIVKCMPFANKDTCAKAKCIWSTGKEFQGKEDMCIPHRIPDTVAGWTECTKDNTETTCPSTCQWFKGDGKLSKGQCYPLASADTVALKEMCTKSTVETVCDKSNCIWKADAVVDAYYCAAIATIPTAADSCKAVKTKDGCTTLKATCHWTQA